MKYVCVHHGVFGGLNDSNGLIAIFVTWPEVVDCVQLNVRPSARRFTGQMISPCNKLSKYESSEER